MRLAEYPDVGKVEHVQAVTGFGRRQIYDAIKREELQAARCGNAIRVTRYALLTWLGVPESVEGPDHNGTLGEMT